jgi:hypothetical protein
MSFAAIHPQIRPLPALASPLVDNLREASIAYSEACRDHFDGVTAGLLANDDVMLSALAEMLVKFADRACQTPRLCNFVDARPQKAELVEILGDIVVDALGGPAGTVVRAHARVFAAG